MLQSSLKKKKLKNAAIWKLKSLYDLIIPPGTVVSIIYDIVEEFGLEPVTRKILVGVANSEEREILVLRGPLEKVQAAEKFLYEEMKAWIENQ